MTLSGNPSKTAQEKPSRRHYRALSDIRVGDNIILLNSGQSYKGKIVAVNVWVQSHYGGVAAAEMESNFKGGHDCTYKGYVFVPSNRGWFIGHNELASVSLEPSPDEVSAETVAAGAEEYHAIFQAKELMESEDV